MEPVYTPARHVLLPRVSSPSPVVEPRVWRRWLVPHPPLIARGFFSSTQVWHACQAAGLDATAAQVHPPAPAVPITRCSVHRTSPWGLSPSAVVPPITRCSVHRTSPWGLSPSAAVPTCSAQVARTVARAAWRQGRTAAAVGWLRYTREHPPNHLQTSGLPPNGCSNVIVAMV